ncbi:MAG: porin family protein [Alphaproteobacteria bacterium]|nr:porin family protein [Alphaproteobacteria bacterium]
MKKIIFILPIILSANAFADNFTPYIGMDAGLNIASYNNDIDLEEQYYTGTINAGMRIGQNFGVELFFTQSADNENTITYEYSPLTQDINISYQSFGFDIFGYYPIVKDMDFFTSFGIANYRISHEFEFNDGLTTYGESDTTTETATRFGIGLMYTFPNDSVSILGQYQYSTLSNELIKSLSEFSIGFRYNF